ncbi:MAG: esterase [Ruminococcus sp.]|nr:esterase [Ruminococcus sp.]
MAKLTYRFFSTSLMRSITFDMLIPGDLPETRAKAGGFAGIKQVLFLLHGYTGSADIWVSEQLAEKYGVTVVMPNGENGFWLDGMSTGHKYATLLGEELPDLISAVFGVKLDASNTSVLGLSMGGFGALHTALAYPERFGRAGVMSPALIVHEVANMEPGSGNGVANYEYYRECFGEPSELLGSKNDPEALADGILADKRKMPSLYICCGTEDFLLPNTAQMHDFLVSRGIEHEFKTSKGGHEMGFWMEYTEKIMEWMYGENAEK